MNRNMVKMAGKLTAVLVLALVLALGLFVSDALADVWWRDNNGVDQWDDDTKTLTISFSVPGNEYYNGDEVKQVKHLVLDIEMNARDNNQMFSRVFSSWTALESVTFNKKAILWDDAFKDCAALKTLTFIGEAEIKSSSFSGCANLETLTFEGKGENAGVSIGDNAFSGCTKLQTLSFGEKADLYGNCFAGCTGLQTVTFGGPLYLDSGAFSECSALSTVTFPTTPTKATLCLHAFAYCTSLTEIALPSSDIQSYAFDGCTNLTTVSLGKYSEDWGLEAGAFDGCPSLTTVTIDPDYDEYKVVDGIVFSKDGKTLHTYPGGKTGASYTIPDSVTKVLLCAFSCNAQLTSLTVPAGMAEMDSIAFIACNNLKTLILQGTTPPKITGSDTFKDFPGFNAVIVPAAALETYLQDAQWRNYADVLQAEFAITYDLDGGTNSAANPAAYTNKSPAITLEEPTRDGYDFIGWTWAGQTEPTKTATIPSGSTGDKAFTAHWKVKAANGRYFDATGTSNPTFYQGGGSSAILVIKNTDPAKDATACDDCVGVRMDSRDGDFLTEGTHYTKGKGSVKISLMPACLDTLAPGQHTLYAYFNDDSVIDIPFTLKASTADPTDTPSPTQSTEPTATPSPTQPTVPTDTPSPWQPTVTPEYGPKKAWNFPKTGDSSLIGLWIGMAVFGAAGIAALAWTGKRKNEKCKIAACRMNDPASRFFCLQIAISDLFVINNEQSVTFFSFPYFVIPCYTIQ